MNSIVLKQISIHVYNRHIDVDFPDYYYDYFLDFKWSEINADY